MVKTRREEVAERLKSEILDAALEIAKKEGWVNVTVRKIAKIIGYSAPAIYRYFKSKEEMMAALYMRALNTFKNHMNVKGDTIDIRQGMVKGAERYWNFGFENPELYELLFTVKTPNFQREEDIKAGREMFLGGLEMIKKVNPSYSFDEQHDYLANYFSLLHGYVHLALSEKLYTEEGLAEDAKKSMLRAVKRFVQTI